MCTNGFVDHAIQDAAGSPILLATDQQIVGRVAYMAAFAEDEPRPPAALSYIRNTVIGGPVPYVYVTRRTYDRPGDTVTLTCMGGPEYPFHEAVYDRDAAFPGDLLTAMDDEVRPFAQPSRPPGQPYDFHWHGLMGYNEGGVRVVGLTRAMADCSTTWAATASAFSPHCAAPTVLPDCSPANRRSRASSTRASCLRPASRRAARAPHR